MPTLYLLDAYALIYRAYYAFINRPLVDAQGRDTSALYGFASTLQDIIDKERPDYIAVAMDMPGGTFRHKEYPEYKANRPETPETIRFSMPYIKELVQAYQIPLLGVEGYEADDLIGTLSRQAVEAGYEVRMVTPDKDYGQLVGPHAQMFAPQRTGSGFELLGAEEITAKYGIRYPLQMIDYLGLVGDSSDNVPGCPGIGKVAAQRLLEEFDSIEDIYARIDQVKPTYAKKLLAAKEQTMLSRHLVTIVTDVQGVTFDPDQMKWRGPDHAAVERIFKEFAFTSLLKRIGKPAETAPQVSLFDLGGSSTPASAPATIEVTGPVSAAAPMENYKTVGVTFTEIQGYEAVSQLAKQLAGSSVVAFDTETDGLDALCAGIVGMSLCADEQQAYFIPLPESAEEAAHILSPLKDLMQDERVLKVAHNAKFDLEVLTRYGLPEARPLYDTMLAHYLIDADQGHSLDELAGGLLRYDTIRYKDLSSQESFALRTDVDPKLLCDYAGEDAYVTLRLYHALHKQLSPTEQRLLTEVEIPLLYVLMHMEQRGIVLDIEALQRSRQELLESVLRLEKEIQSYSSRGLNLKVNSPKQIGELLFDELKIMEKPRKTKTGNYVTNEETLLPLRSLHPVVALILDYREARKLLNTYIDPLPKMCYPDGKLHTSYNQAVTATGRLSSSNPNLQNIPIRSDLGRPLRRAFVADPYYTPRLSACTPVDHTHEEPIGAVLLSADYSQVELRVMAHLSQDPAMIHSFLSGDDIHTATAAKVFKVAPEEVTPLMRSKAKTANFGINYGITPYGLSQRLNIPVGEAAELIKEYFATFTHIQAFMNEAIALATERGYTETAFGRRRQLRNLRTARGAQRGNEERNAINAPIQGTAADIIKIAMIRVEEELTKQQLRSYLVLQVHDELILNVYLDELERVTALVREAMEGAWPECSVPLVVEIGTGKDWLAAH